MSTKRKSIGNKTESNKRVKAIEEEQEESQVTQVPKGIQEDINIAREKARQWHENQMKLAGLRKSEENKVNTLGALRKSRYSVDTITTSNSNLSSTSSSSILTNEIRTRNSRKSELPLPKTEKVISQIRTRSSLLSNNNNSTNNNFGITRNINEHQYENETKGTNNESNKGKYSRSKKNEVVEDETVVIPEPFTSESSTTSIPNSTTSNYSSYSNSTVSAPFDSNNSLSTSTSTSTTPTPIPTSPSPKPTNSLTSSPPRSGFKTIEQRMNSVPPVLAPIVSPTFPTIPEDPPVEYSWISAKYVILFCLLPAVFIVLLLHTESFSELSRKIKPQIDLVEAMMTKEFGPSQLGIDYTSFLLIAATIITLIFLSTN